MLLHGWSLNLRVWDSVVRDALTRDCPRHRHRPARTRQERLGRHARATPAAQAWRVHETLAPSPSATRCSAGLSAGQFALDLAGGDAGGIERLVLVSTTPRFLAGAGWPLRHRAGAADAARRPGGRGDGQAVDEFLALQVRGNAPRTAARVLKSLRSGAGSATAPRGRKRSRTASSAALNGGPAPGARRWCACRRWWSAGTRDRIVRPGASRALAALCRCALRGIQRRRARPFLSHPQRFATAGGGLCPWLSCGGCLSPRPPAQCAPAFDRASGRYEAAARLQAQVGDELLGRLGAFGLRPRRGARPRRRHRTPRARTAAPLPARPRRGGGSRPWDAQARRATTSGCGGALRASAATPRRLPLASASVDLVFSNLMLQWCQPPDAALAEVRRVLRPGGFLAFSTFGPATLQELRSAWAQRRRLQPRESLPRRPRRRRGAGARRTHRSRCWTSTATRCATPTRSR